MIVSLAQDAARADDGVLCQLADGRVFVAVGDTVRPFMEPADADALPAFNRAWSHSPSLFRGPLTPRRPVVPHLPGPGMIADMLPGDVAKLRLIVLKHRKAYFADHPTPAQVDQLIESLGPIVLEKIVKAAVDAGRF